MTNNFLVVIPFNLPWKWSTDYLNQTAFELAKKGNFIICYMWSESLSLFEYIRNKKSPKLVIKHSENIILFYPIHFIPFRRFKLISKLNELINVFLLRLFILKQTINSNFNKKILWLFEPRFVGFTKYFSKQWFLIYDCVDYFSESDEKMLLPRADLVVANSQVLTNRLRKSRKDVELVPQGFRLSSFKNIYKDIKIKRNDRPLIGFVGAINYRIDYKFLYLLAVKKPNWDFALWGPLLEDIPFPKLQKKYYQKLLSLKNVIVGKSSKSDIPNVIRQFDVGVIPYDISLKFNKYCYPMKLFEYFYLGKPVVSTNIIELHRFPDLVCISDSVSGWQSHIQKFLNTGLSAKDVKKARMLALENSWKNKVADIVNLIEIE